MRTHFPVGRIIFSTLWAFHKKHLLIIRKTIISQSLIKSIALRSKTTDSLRFYLLFFLRKKSLFFREEIRVCREGIKNKKKKLQMRLFPLGGDVGTKTELTIV